MRACYGLPSLAHEYEDSLLGLSQDLGVYLNYRSEPLCSTMATA